MDKFLSHYSHMSLLALQNNRFHLAERCQIEGGKDPETVERIEAIDHLMQIKQVHLDTVD